MLFELSALAGLAAALGVSARWNWWRFRAAGVPVLMYHKVGDPPPGSKLKKLWVSGAQFRRHMRFLKEHGYGPLTFGDLAALLDAGKPLPPKAVVITFDDGYRNNYEKAFPVLQEHGFKAVVFLVVHAVGRDNFWHDPAAETRVAMMTWEEAAAMARGGMEFGSHTLTHPRLTQLQPPQAFDEIKLSREEILRRLGHVSPCFANPYGDGARNHHTQKMIEEAGYRWAVSVRQGKADFLREPYCLKRIFVRGDDCLWDFHLNLTRGKARF